MATVTYSLVTAQVAVPDAGRIASALAERGVKVVPEMQAGQGCSWRHLNLLHPTVQKCDIMVEALQEAMGVPVDTEYLEREDRHLLRRSAGRLYTLRCSSPEGKEMEGVLYVVAVADALLELVGGVILDHASQTAWGRSDWKAHVSWTTFRVADHIRIHSIHDAEETALWMHTHGLVKFGRPELELISVHPGYVTAGGILLHHIAEFMAEGADIGHGNTMDIGFGTVAFMDARTFLAVFAPDFPDERDREGHDSDSLIILDMEAKDNWSTFINPLLAHIDAGMHGGG